MALHSSKPPRRKTGLNTHGPGKPPGVPKKTSKRKKKKK